MTYRQRLSLFIFIDSCIVLISLFISRLLVNSSFYAMTLSFLITMMAILVSHLYFSFKLNLYKKVWEYASVGELLIIFKTVTYSLLVTGVVQFIVFQAIFIKMLTLTWMLHILLIGGSRFLWRVYRNSFILPELNHKRALIVGAGSAGTMVVRQLQKSNDSRLAPIAFVDDDFKKHRLDILGIPVAGGVSEIEKIVDELEIANIIIAIPSLNKQELNVIFKECAKTEAKTQILPMLEDLVTGKVSVKQFRDVEVEDLLGREPVVLDTDSISDYVKGKVVLVTGAGGSIGSEITRQVSKFHPKRLILLGHGENSIYSIEKELRSSFADTGVEFITEIADIQDEVKMMNVIGFHHPDVIYHAAAHKHVPLMERNPDEAVKNNVIGTWNVAKAASWHDVSTFVMISTDKAVNPTSVMGATKRLAEMIVQNMNQKSETKFVAVRFGNVLGSRGSVIPLFKEQIEKGGPVTVTHPEMVRYFMTIPEASRLVIQAGALTKGGEIFVLDMGAPVKIVDLAKNLIKLSGNTLEEIGVEFSGIRPGEKLFEELLKADEVYKNQVYPKIYIGKTIQLYIEEIEEMISIYETLNKEALREKLVNLANHAEAEQTPIVPITS
ncbi:polysaccharide biosynthesis protein [Halobacillus amylolyticus]|uniref:Polysaccharide biosynthesis protein n=1 Tax=Halobacillus amylolyticus TaxID=2932259 RepID=A0ABY4HGQ1_9BACI|nr:nucleoside-diphosphate sugar epimerase/dehydratase [Halobacillus amylolyticus]UOR13804.1 polysaccharide biosynthesis protein [Halobacillus amylolyticus]